MVSESPTEQCKSIIDALGLTELGYQATMTTTGGHISVQLDHALRGDCSWTITTDVTAANWPKHLERIISDWPDLRVALTASAIRPESVPLVALLRHQELVERAANAKSQEATAVAVEAIRRIALAFRGRLGALNDADIEWLFAAFEADGDSDTA